VRALGLGYVDARNYVIVTVSCEVNRLNSKVNRLAFNQNY